MHCCMSVGKTTAWRCVVNHSDTTHLVLNTCLQARTAGGHDQAQAVLHELKLPLQHKIRCGPLPASLLMAATVVGLPPESLKNAFSNSGALDVASELAKQAQQTILGPVMTMSKNKVVHAVSVCQDMLLSSPHDPMLHCICTYLQGQMKVLRSALEHLTEQAAVVSVSCATHCAH